MLIQYNISIAYECQTYRWEVNTVKNLIIRWFVSALSIYIIAYLLEGIYVTDFTATLIAAAILGIVNAIIKPLLIILTLPINILTLGLFTFIINGIVLKLTASLVNGFMVRGLFAAVIGSILISIVNMILTNLIGVKK